MSVRLPDSHFKKGPPFLNPLGCSRLDRNGRGIFAFLDRLRSQTLEFFSRDFASKVEPSATQWPMKHGRIIRVSERQSYATYIVAEEDVAKAVALIKKVVGLGPVVQSIGRASLKLLDAVGLSAGEYNQTQND